MRSLIKMGAETFAETAARLQIPFAVAMAADADQIFFTETYGPAKTESIFAIASMTKAITTTAAMQLVEQGVLHLDERVDCYLPELRDLPVLEGFDAAGAPRFGPLKRQITLLDLLTHTAGFAYNWNHPITAPHLFLVHQPGAKWHYGTSIDWVGKLIEAVAKQSLEAYFQRFILGPLAMNDTSFLLPPEKLDRLVPPRVQPPAPPFFNGGGGLFSTAEDYICFTQMILRRGLAKNGERILSEASILAMSSNQTGDLDVGRIQSTMPERSCDVDFHPGSRDRFGLGFLINPVAHAGGRSAGSLAWGGIRNTFYWIDPQRRIAAVLLMQFQPFCHPAAIEMLNRFESSVYRIFLARGR